jgi:hypothetical protein
MKKILPAIFTCVSASLFAQLPVSTVPENKKAVLEEFTGIHCGYCPDGHRIGTQIYNADPTKVVLINIHSGSFANAAVGEPDFKTPEGTAIDQMPGMGITGYPAGTMNREILVGSSMATGRGSWTSMANTIKSQPAFCNVALQGTLNPQTRVLTVDVEVYYTANSPVTTNSLNVFLLENKIPGVQSNYGSPLYNLANYNENGTYNHNHVLRKALTPTFGMTIPNTTATTLFTTTLTYTLPMTYGASGKTTIPKMENLLLAGFVTQTDRKIANAANGPILLTNDLKAVSVDVPGIVCGKAVSGVVTVQNTGMTTITDLTVTPAINNVTGNVTTWSGILAPGASTTITLNSINAPSGGGHSFSYSITAVNPVDAYTSNNSGKVSFYSASDFASTPVAEGFVAGTFPPAGWAQINVNKGPAWTRITSAGSYSLWPLHSIKYDFYTNSVIGDKDELILPPMDLAGAAKPTLDFDLAYAMRNSSSNDKLEVLASDDCGVTWTSFYSLSGSMLATTITEYPYDLLPSDLSADLWRTESVELTGFNKSDVLVKFVTTNANGSTMYLDNINLSQKNPVGLGNMNSSVSNVLIYPNPASGSANIRINTVKAAEANVSVLNMLGQVVLAKDVDLTAGANRVELDTRQLAAGVYHVAITADNNTFTKKLTISK